MSASVFAAHAAIGERYVTKGGWPVTVLEIGKQVLVQNDLTGERHKLDKGQLLWPYSEKLISKEAITMARAKGHKKAVAKKTRAPKKQTKAVAAAEPKYGDIFSRGYKGEEHEVERHADGYYYRGEKFTSLTAVAKKITGYPSISGPAFFKTAQPVQPAAQPDPALVPAQ